MLIFKYFWTVRFLNNLYFRCSTSVLCQGKTKASFVVTVSCLCSTWKWFINTRDPQGCCSGFNQVLRFFLFNIFKFFTMCFLQGFWNRSFLTAQRSPWFILKISTISSMPGEVFLVTFVLPISFYFVGDSLFSFFLPCWQSLLFFTPFLSENLTDIKPVAGYTRFKDYIL